MQSTSVLVFALLIFGFACPAMAESNASSRATPESVRKWIEKWGDKFDQRYHPSYQSQYPGGQSNRHHDAYLKNVFRKSEWPANINWKIFNKAYSYDEDWFIVEWLFQAEDKKTGKLQREGTLAFGRIENDQLIMWIEYFDGFVAPLQRAGALPLYAEDAEPFPWPAPTATTRKYRP
jgi:hypothetical protein